MRSNQGEDEKNGDAKQPSQTPGEDSKETDGSNYNNNGLARTRVLRDPYSLLNLSSETATEADIQRAYKRGSRALHPDKQAASLLRTGEISESAAQQAFVAFKDACKCQVVPFLNFLASRHLKNIYFHFWIRQMTFYQILFCVKPMICLGIQAYPL